MNFGVPSRFDRRPRREDERRCGRPRSGSCRCRPDWLLIDLTIAARCVAGSRLPSVGPLMWLKAKVDDGALLFQPISMATSSFTSRISPGAAAGRRSGISSYFQSVRMTRAESAPGQSPSLERSPLSHEEGHEDGAGPATVAGVSIVTGAFVALLVVDVYFGQLPTWILAAYGLMVPLSIQLYRQDKHAAQHGEWRVSERTVVAGRYARRVDRRGVRAGRAAPQGAKGVVPDFLLDHRQRPLFPMPGCGQSNPCARRLPVYSRRRSCSTLAIITAPDERFQLRCAHS